MAQQIPLIQQFNALKQNSDKVRFVCTLGRQFAPVKKSSTGKQQAAAIACTPEAFQTFLEELCAQSKDIQDKWFSLQAAIAAQDKKHVLSLFKSARGSIIVQRPALLYLLRGNHLSQDDIFKILEGKYAGLELSITLRRDFIRRLANYGQKLSKKESPSSNNGTSFTIALMKHLKSINKLNEVVYMLAFADLKNEQIRNEALALCDISLAQGDESLSILGNVLESNTIKKLCRKQPQFAMTLIEHEFQQNKSVSNAWSVVSMTIKMLMQVSRNKEFSQRLMQWASKYRPVANSLSAHVFEAQGTLAKHCPTEFVQLVTSAINGKGVIDVQQSYIGLVFQADTFKNLNADHIASIWKALSATSNSEFAVREFLSKMPRHYNHLNKRFHLACDAIEKVHPEIVDWCVKNNLPIEFCTWLPKKWGSAISQKLLDIAEKRGQTMNEIDRSVYWVYLDYSTYHSQLMKAVSTPDVNTRARMYARVLHNALYNDVNIEECFRDVEKKIRNEQQTIVRSTVANEIVSWRNLPYLHTQIIPNYVYDLEDIIKPLFKLRDAPTDSDMYYVNQLAWLMLRRFFNYDMNQMKPFGKTVKVACNFIVEILKNFGNIAPAFCPLLNNNASIALDTLTGFVKDELEYNLEKDTFTTAAKLTMIYRNPSLNPIIDSTLSNYFAKQFQKLKEVPQRKRKEFEQMVKIWIGSPKTCGKKVKTLLDLDPSMVRLKCIQQYLFSSMQSRLNRYLKVEKQITIEDLKKLNKKKDLAAINTCKYVMFSENTHFCFDADLIAHYAVRLTGKQRKLLARMIMDFINDDQRIGKADINDKKGYLKALACLQFQEKEDEEITKFLQQLYKEAENEGLAQASLASRAFQSAYPHGCVRFLLDEVSSQNACVLMGGLRRALKYVTPADAEHALHNFFITNTEFIKRGVTLQKETLRLLLVLKNFSAASVISTILLPLWNTRDLHKDTRATIVSIAVQFLRNAAHLDSLWALLKEAATHEHQAVVQALFVPQPVQNVSANFSVLKRLSELQLLVLDHPNPTIQSIGWMSIYTSYGTQSTVATKAKSAVLNTQFSYQNIDKARNAITLLINCLVYATTPEVGEEMRNNIYSVIETLCTSDDFKKAEEENNASISVSNPRDLPTRKRIQYICTSLISRREIILVDAKARQWFIKIAQLLCKFSSDMVNDALKLHVHATQWSTGSTTSAQLIESLTGMIAFASQQIGCAASEAFALNKLGDYIMDEQHALNPDTAVLTDTLLQLITEQAHHTNMGIICYHLLQIVVRNSGRDDVTRQIAKALRQSKLQMVKYLACHQLDMSS